MISRQLKQYRIVEAIGAGGMGEVYRAHDTRLGRDVAVKVLPQGSLADESARRRFRKEALALSRLSHPHIASLFDFDTTEDGLDFLVMELVSGPSLDTRLKRGPFEEKEVVRLGSQVARALVAAHERGIVHRDLKPQNLRLTADGLVKVLDFGLAQLAVAKADGATTDTASGIAAGTPPYMSPEQLLGKEVDDRTDVYAAGVVLYELLTGRRPFGDASGPQLVAKILSEDAPGARTLSPSVSAELEQVILKATDRDKELRHQTAKDLLVDLERLAIGKAPSSEGRAGHERLHDGSALGERVRRWRAPSSLGGAARWALRAVVILVSIAGLVGGVAWLLRPGTPHITFTRTLVRVAIANNGLATDGVNVYYAEAVRPADRLMVVPITGGQPHEIQLPWRGQLNLRLLGLRTEPVELLLAREQELWRLPLSTGAPLRVDGISRLGEAAWSHHGDRLAWIELGDASDTLWVSDAAGGNRRRLLDTPKEQRGGRSAWLAGWHPAGDRLVVSRRGAECYVEVSVATGVPRDVWFPCDPDLWGSGAWTPDGAFFVHGSIRGFLAYPRGRGTWPWRRALAVAAGGPTHVVSPAFAPDGTHVVGYVLRPANEVVRLDPATRAVEPLLGGAWSGAVGFAPDGSRVAWVSTESTLGRLWVSRADGSERLPLGDRIVKPEIPPAWSPDGRWIAFSALAGLDAVNEALALYLASPDQGSVERLTPEAADAGQVDPCWAPDGRSLAFAPSPFWGLPPDAEVYLRHVDLATRRVTKLAGSEGLWSPKCARDGRLLAKDLFAQRAHDEKRPDTGRDFFKMRDPSTGQWRALTVDRPADPPAGPNGLLWYPTWSPDGHHVYALRLGPRRTVVRFRVTDGRLEDVFDVDGLGSSDAWLGVDPTGAPLVHRDVSRREIVVMGFEER